MPTATFDAVLDGAVLHATALAAVRDNGTFVGVPSASPATPERGIDIGIVSVIPDNAQLTALLTQAVTGVLELRVAARVPLTEALAAYDNVATGGQRGRWLLLP
ncbi:zinc-binding dehydrogenase [Actinosynnema sp. NPDC023794]